MRLRGLAPIVGAKPRVLVLGSFPSAASLAAQQYYAHPRNQFWRILGAVLDADLHHADYTVRCDAVRAAGIAIWDSYATCVRPGSLDSAIREAVPTDVAGLIRESAPATDVNVPAVDQKSALAGRRQTGSAAGIVRVCFNGRSAAKREREIAALGVETVVLPSTSPAHAGMRFEEKLACWRAALEVAG